MYINPLAYVPAKNMSQHKLSTGGVSAAAAEYPSVMPIAAVAVNDEDQEP